MQGDTYILISSDSDSHLYLKSSSMSLFLHFYKISGIYLGRHWTSAVYLEMPKTFFIATTTKLLAVSFQRYIYHIYIDYMYSL